MWGFGVCFVEKLPLSLRAGNTTAFNNQAASCDLAKHGNLYTIPTYFNLVHEFVPSTAGRSTCRYPKHTPWFLAPLRNGNATRLVAMMHCNFFACVHYLSHTFEDAEAGALKFCVHC